MENIPPSYESAIARKPWHIIAPYISSADLCALNRVNRNLHETFAPYLWGNPASHFGTENDRVYVALTRFKRALKRVRLNVRELTHTLNLPPAQSEIYDGPHPQWLRDVLEQLPNLQSLVVSRLPFFDHMALLALRSYSDNRRPSVEDEAPGYGLRLLIAARCQNTTSLGLAEGLTHFSHLAFLDLSNTLAARDKYVLSRLGKLSLLQVLKLRSIHLRDDDIAILAHAIGIRVRSLDVQGNHLTDHSVRTLLSSCFQTQHAVSGSPNVRPYAFSNLAVEDWPSGFVRPDPAVLDEFKDESYDERFVRRLTSGTISRLPFEDFPPSGITHLYIADNNLTVEGLASLIRSGKLHVLDAGSLNQGTILNRPRPASSTSTPHPHDDNRPVQIPGVEKLTPLLGKFAGELTSLRLHHALITEDAVTKVDEPLGTCELDAKNTATQEVQAGAEIQEMDAMPPLYELEPREPAPRFELPGDAAYVVVSPLIGDKPSLAEEESQPDVRRGSVYAPEVIEQDGSEDDLPPILTATGLGGVAQAVNGVDDSDLRTTIEERTEAFVAREDNTAMQLALIEQQRTRLRSKRLESPHGLIPGMMPKLRVLTLTDVPSYARSARVHEYLIQFIKDCASENELAILQARLEPSQLRKPGERQSKHHRHNAREIFALKYIILEMAPVVSSLAPQSSQSPHFSRNTRSSTEDADSEALWSAAENDFTFFDNDEECGLPSVDSDSYIPYSALAEKIFLPATGSTTQRLPTIQSPARKETLTDVVHELAKFRKERKTAYDNALLRGVQYVDGYWPGEIKIVRGHHTGGKTDYYGFEKTGIYR